MTPASTFFQEIDRIREEHPDVREVFINHPMSADGRLNLDWDRGLTKLDSIDYEPELIYYKNHYWDNRDELHEYLYDSSDMDDGEIDDYIDNLQSFDAIIIYTR